ncbi:antithrombin-iii-like isoform 2 protein [Lasius niger]|uniref:Antithrombin-iii-like isoform 2 protein n=1 Tax=Lasius niger TaxID=67767 RepID=A0A0J7K4Q7_LASNI|nr:antithrombin-iii-like isoform 2 protein [Lasius niger]
MDFILSSVLSCEDKRFEPVCKNLLPGIHLLRKPITVLSPKLGMFMTEVPYINQSHSMFVLFPAVQSDQDRYKWEIDHQSISGLIEKLTTEEGTDELRKVLDFSPQPPIENLILPDSFNLEYDLSIDELLQDLGIQQLLEPDHSSLSNFSDDDLHLGGAMYRAYVRVHSTHVTAGAINIFFTKNEGSFKSIEETNYSQYKQSFVWLIYDRLCHTILFIGVINKNLPQVSSSEQTASSSNTVELKQ